LGHQDELVATVLFPGRLVVTGIGRAGSAVSDGFDALGIDAQVGQILARSQRAPLAQGKIVFLGSAFVAVAFNSQALELFVVLK